MSDSQHGTALQVAALKAAFESFAESVGKRMDRWERDVTGIAERVEAQIRALREDMVRGQESMRAQHVSLDRFRPVERIAYGLASLALAAVVGALVKLVVH